MERRSTSPLLRVLSPLRDFLHTEAAGGVLLVLAAIAALVWANSPWQQSYVDFWHTMIGFDIGNFSIHMDLVHWINDAAMTIFFLVVGLEIKREVTTGHLASRKAASLPVAAALGGMILPALIYLLIAGGEAPKGWGVPMATDIALAVGVVTLAGAAVPSSLRAFLLGLAVVDDIGAIIVIAVFYSSRVSAGWLGIEGVTLIAILIVKRLGVHNMLVYVALGTVLWLALYEAGIHPTLAGVVLGLLAPATPRYNPELIDEEELGDVSDIEHARATVAMARGSVSTVEWLEYVLHPWTSFVIVPVFALANAGIEISSTSVRHAIESPITWGILAGLVLGKPIGVLLSAKLAVRTKLADPPPGSSTRHLLGAGNAAGIGFTVAIFIAELAFAGDRVAVDDAKMAILVASLVSGVVAFLVLSLGGRRSSRTRSAAPAAARA